MKRTYRVAAGALIGVLVLVVGGPSLRAQQKQFRFETGEKFSADEANQAVAVDDEHVYAIDSHAIGKYDKKTGERVDGWKGEKDGAIHHLNSGVVVDGILYCAHSNFPGVPMVSSIEKFDVETMEHVGSHPFGIRAGSATWVDRHEGDWWVVFAHYEGDGGVPGKGPEWTRLIRFDDAWRAKGGWAFPSRVIDEFRPYSNSGGAWGPKGRLYVTGHDATEVYVLRRPNAGATLEYLQTLDMPAEGQGIAWDPERPSVLYGILRSEREIVPARLESSSERRRDEAAGDE